jgi:hypothetical protein
LVAPSSPSPLLNLRGPRLRTSDVRQNARFVQGRGRPKVHPGRVSAVFVPWREHGLRSIFLAQSGFHSVHVHSILSNREDLRVVDYLLPPKSIVELSNEHSSLAPFSIPQIVQESRRTRYIQTYERGFATRARVGPCKGEGGCSMVLGVGCFPPLPPHIIASASRDERELIYAE